MTKDEALKLARTALGVQLDALLGKAGHLRNDDRKRYAENGIKAIDEALAQPEPWEKFCDSNCVWTDHHPDCKMAQPSVSVEQEPVAWRYKPVREDNPRWEYTTNHPLDMGDGYLRPSLVEYCKCIEPLYAKEKPKLMLEKFREMKDLLDDTTPPQRTQPEQEPVGEIVDAIEGSFKCSFTKMLPIGAKLYTSPPQRKPLTDEEVNKLVDDEDWYNFPHEFAKAVEAALRSKNT